MLFIVWLHITFNGDVLFQEMLVVLVPEVYLDFYVILCLLINNYGHTY